MANILFGSPQEESRGEALNSNYKHFDLIARLEEEGHEINYVCRENIMLGELNALALSKKLKYAKANNYALILYDTSLFYNQSSLHLRTSMFNNRISKSLKETGLPVIVLADAQISEQIMERSREAGFKQINQPYNLDEVLREVNTFISR